MIFGHGDDTYRYGDKIRWNFSSCMYGQADLSALQRHLSACMDCITTYPEPEPLELEAMIAEQEGVSANAVMVTAGVTEAIYLIAQAFQGSESVIPQPTFSEYADACRTFQHIVSHQNHDKLEHSPKNRIYWICNPNNPTGNVLLKPLLNHVVRTHPKNLYVIDQAYEDYTLMPMLEACETVDCDNLFVLHSMTKKYAIPGLRIGYIVASPTLLDRLRYLRRPWSVDSLAIEAGKYLVSHRVQIIPDLRALLNEADRLKKALEEMDGLRVLDSQTHFMLIQLKEGNATALKDYLIHQHGILIRDASNFEGLNQQYFRISTQCAEANDLLVAALRQYLTEVV